MWSCVICTTQFLEVLRPPSLSLRWEGTKQVKEHSVESLTLSISLQVVRSALGFLDSIHAGQFLYHFSFKTPSLVRMNSLGDTIHKETVTYQGFDYSAGPLISC